MQGPKLKFSASGLLRKQRTWRECKKGVLGDKTRKRNLQPLGLLQRNSFLKRHQLLDTVFQDAHMRKQLGSHDFVRL